MIDLRVQPESVGMSSRSLKIVDSHLRSYIDDGKLPGASVLIARRGKIAHLGTFGLADRERTVPIGPDTIFRIYSMTKPLTSVALMQLYERGMVQLDDPVHNYIPSWRDLRVFDKGEYPNIQTVPPDRAITVRDLLSHQAGLTYGIFDNSSVDKAYNAAQPLDSAGTLDDMVDKLSRLPLKHSPGRRWNYSVSSDVVGYLVQLISGQRFDEYLAQHILEPLEMVDTSFWVRPDHVQRFAASYRATTHGEYALIDDPQSSTFTTEPTLFLGGGGLTSTALDYWRFSQALCNGGTLEGKRIIGRKTLQLMTSNHLADGCDLASVAYGKWSETTYDGIGFGLGVAVTLDPTVAQISGSPGDFFWGGMASTAFFVDPSEELVMVFMTQLMPSSKYNLRRELRALVYGALL